MQSKEFELKIISHVSNELLFEYYIKSGHLKISEKFGQIVDIARKKDDVTDMLKYALSTLVNKDVSEAVSAINLPLADGNIGVFKVISLSLYDEHGQLYSIIGKLTDISKEQAEKERLISKSQLDGLTGLYNATTTRELIAKSLINKPENIKDALMIIDCDNFKNINDTVGHLKGDLALKNISQGLLLTFRKSDIVGRIGGDEFCIYMHNVPSADFVRSKCRKLNDIIQEINREFPVAISIGITIWSKDSSYEKLFKQADDALYIAKRNGGAQAVIYGEKKYLATGTGAGVL